MSTAIAEHRVADRPPPPPPAPRLRITLLVNALTNAIETRGSHAALFCLVVIGCLATFGWTLAVRLPSLEQHGGQMKQVMRLESETESLKRRWSQQELDRLAAGIASAEMRIMPNYQVLAEWLRQEAVRAGQIGLRLSYTLGETAWIKGVDGVMAQPIHLTLETDSLPSEHAYGPMLAFLQGVTAQHWRMELASAAMEGGGKGVGQLKAELRLWIHPQPHSKPEEGS